MSRGQLVQLGSPPGLKQQMQTLGRRAKWHVAAWLPICVSVAQPPAWPLKFSPAVTLRVGCRPMALSLRGACSACTSLNLLGREASQYEGILAEEPLSPAQLSPLLASQPGGGDRQPMGARTRELPPTTAWATTGQMKLHSFAAKQRV